MIWGRNRKIRKPREWLQDGSAWVVALAWRVARPVAWIAGLALFVFAAYTGWDRLNESPVFRLHRVDVQGTADMTVDEVAAACGLVTDRTNVVLTLPSCVRDACLADPRIRDVSVEVEPPDRIRLSVLERRAELYAVLPDGIWAVSPQAELFARVDPLAMRPLTILTGAADILRDDPEPRLPEGKTTRDERAAYRQAVSAHEERAARRDELLREALSLARVVQRGTVPAWGDEPLELAWSPVMGFTVAPVGGGLVARFGHAPFGRKITRLKLALMAVEGPQATATHAFLDNEARPYEVTVRLKPAPVSAATDGNLEALP